MYYLKDKDEKEAVTYLKQATRIARAASCKEARCGSVIAKEGMIIGAGFNSPPLELESQRRCHTDKTTYNAKITDTTCCIHAEQRAIMDALQTHAQQLAGARLYFSRADESGKPIRSGEPWCTICSKMALDVGIAEFVLWHDAGVAVYGTEEYNDVSYRYGI